MDYIISIILGGIGGVIVSTIVTWRILRENTARKLLDKALEIQALNEVWILDGNNYQQLAFSENEQLTENRENINYIKKVELRFILDDAKWNFPDSIYYGLVKTRRTWIVRDRILNVELAYQGGKPGDYHPALISSRAKEELTGWIEMVTSAKNGLMLSSHGMKMLKPLLGAITTDDRINFFKKDNALSENAMKFLEWYNKQNSKNK